MKHFFLFCAAALVSAVASSQTWVKVNEIPDSSVWSVVNQNNTLYVGITGKVYIGANNGASWTASADVGSKPIFTITLFKNKLYAGTFGDGVFQSSDNGAHWQAVNAGLALLGITKLVVWNNTLFASTDGEGMFRFNDATNQWTAFNNNFPTIVDGLVWDMVSTGSTLVAAAGANGFFYKFDTVQQSWNTTDYFGFARPGYIVFSLMQDGPALYAAGQDFLWRSNDTGNTWTFDRTGMHIGNQLLTASNQKDYVATNFLDLNTGLNTVRVYERASGVSAGTLWTETDSMISYFYSLAATNGRLYSGRDTGLYFKQIEAVTGVPDIISHLQEIRVFPNPSKGRAIIHFELTERKKLSVQVLDITGKLISTPYHDLNLNTGQQDLSIDLSRLEQGVYFIRILSGNEQSVARVVVSR